MRSPTQHTIRARLVRLSIAVLGVSLLSAAGASPAFAGAWWRVSSRAAPTFLAHGGKATIVVGATNVGDGAVNATTTPVTIEDTLPPNLEATEIRGEPAFNKEASHLMTCELSTLTCTSKPETLPAFERLEVIITVNVKPDASTGEKNQVNVHGGEQEGAPGQAVPGASHSQSLTVNDQPTVFGVEEDGYALTPEEEGGALDTQAGSHPFQLTTTLNLDQTLESNPRSGPTESAPELPRNLSFNLPPGLIGDPRAVTACATLDFLAIGEAATNACKPESAIGVVVVTLDEPNHFGDITRAVPLWNLEPAQGEPARFGFEVIKVPVVLDTSVRSGGDYGVNVDVSNAPESAQILASEVTIWGVPGEASHDQSRGWACLLGGVYFNHEVPCEPPSPRSTAAFLALPTSCTGPVRTSVEGQSWPVKTLASEPGEIFSLRGSSTEDELPGFEGCASLPFKPSIGTEPVQEAEDGHPESKTTAANTPTGLKVDVHVPQQSTLEAGGLAEADVQATTVSLPEGMSLNPAAADGLQACNEQQMGFEGQAGEDPFSPGAPQPLKFSTAPASCPDASKVGGVDIKTPLLEHELQGAVYLAEPAPQGEAHKNPFNSLLALYLVAEDPASGIRVKLAGETKLNQSTGQVTSTFLNTPQVPFEDLQLQLFGGPRGSVSTPPLCGAYTTKASFTPWSGSQQFTASSEPSTFDITSGASGGSCSDPLPFAPSFQAGSTNLQAGAFSPFSLTIARPDGDQPLQGLSMSLPPGVAALLSTVTPCPEPPAGQEWACGAESLIGHSTASSGLGPDPVTLGGQAFLTVGYDGAPFGLLVVTPAVAGPFDLGNVDVRSRINVNPNTAAVTITSDPFPTFVKGVPVALKQINVTVDRPNFEFNPTNCDPMRIEGTLTSAQNASEAVSSPFQVDNCQTLPFAPKLTAVAGGRGSKANGTSLAVTVTSGGVGPSGVAQAGIAKVDLALPVALSSRLSTLQKACTEAVFDANPASCNEDSAIGYATIHTPVLSNPLSGPAYLVSHGGAAFPDVEFVLQGEGITLVLDGKTDIKAGVTYSRFESAPDAPFTVFETVLPAGPHGVLTANVPEREEYSLCKASLAMPTEITGQNGAILNQTTNIAVTGCAGVKDSRAVKLTRAQLLAKALKACKKYKKKARRAACEKQARKRYRATKAAHKTAAHKATSAVSAGK